MFHGTLIFISFSQFQAREKCFMQSFYSIYQSISIFWVFLTQVLNNNRIIVLLIMA